MSFQLSCESTVDVPFSHMKSRSVSVLFYNYAVDGQEYVDDMGRDPQALPHFYDMLAAGKMPTTSQIVQYKYEEYFDELLQKGDVLHLVFGSGMTNSINGALGAQEVMQKKYPDRRLIVIDSTCSSSGYGMLVDSVCDLRDEGCSMDEIEAWITDHRLHMHHQFFSTDLTYFRRGGRVSGVAATLGTILGICPLMHLNLEGRIIAYGKTRGKLNAMKETIRVMEAHAEGGINYSGKCWISHSHCIEDAEKMKNMILAHFPNVHEVRTFDIGTIIAAHTGPGTVATFFYGDERIDDH